MKVCVLFLCILCIFTYTHETYVFKVVPTMVKLRGGNSNDDKMIEDDLILDSHVSNTSCRLPFSFQDDDLDNVESRDLIIPDTHPTLELALQASDHGDQIFARAGVHHAAEALFVNRSSIHVCGDEQANLLCRWFLMENSWGTFQVVASIKSSIVLSQLKKSMLSRLMKLTLLY